MGERKLLWEKEILIAEPGVNTFGLGVVNRRYRRADGEEEDWWLARLPDAVTIVGEVPDGRWIAVSEFEAAVGEEGEKAELVLGFRAPAWLQEEGDETRDLMGVPHILEMNAFGPLLHDPVEVGEPWSDSENAVQIHAAEELSSLKDDLSLQPAEVLQAVRIH